MISRRSIRVKVMQTIYASEIGGEQDLVFAEKMLQENVDRTIEINLVYLLYFVEIARYVFIYADMQKSKYLLTEEEKNINTNIGKSTIVNYIHDNPIFNKIVKKYRTHQHLDESIVKDYFFKLLESAEYKNYTSIAEPTIDDDKEVFQYIIKKIFGKEEDLINHLESYFINVYDDTELICFSLKRSIKNFNLNNKTNFELGFDDWEEEREYAFDLLRLTINKSQEYDKIIEPKLKGWETERIAKTDLIILKMAIGEMLNFPTIPLKVTMNEYIDLCKMYSPPKSKEFVNGVLDRLMKEFTAENKILKSGRGLQD